VVVTTWWLLQRKAKDKIRKSYHVASFFNTRRCFMMFVRHKQVLPEQLQQAKHGMDSLVQHYQWKAHVVRQGKSKEHNVGYQMVVCEFIRSEDAERIGGWYSKYLIVLIHNA
jgi:hypothetical protein